MGYGSLKSGAPLKKNYTLPRAQMENADVARIINSDEVQSVLRPKLEQPKKFAVKKNPLKNPLVMARLNPGILQKRALRKRSHQKGTEDNKLVQKKKKETADASKKHNASQKGDNKFYNKLMKAFEIKAEEKKDEEADE